MAGSARREPVDEDFDPTNPEQSWSTSGAVGFRNLYEGASFGALNALQSREEAMSQRKNRIGWVFAALGVVLLFALACDAEYEGEEGNLTFKYEETGLDTPPTDGALAVGTRVDVRVRATPSPEDDSNATAENGDQEETENSGDDGGDTSENDDSDGDQFATIVDAYSDDAQTLEVAERSEQQFTLQAHQAGPPEGTRIHVVAQVDGGEVEDSFTIRTAEAAGVNLGSLCEESLFFTDTHVPFSYDMRDDSDEKLTGIGHYPVAIDPSEGGTIRDEQPQIQTLRVDTGSQPGEYAVVPEIDGESADFELIDSSGVDAIDLSASEDGDPRVAAGEEEQVAMFGLLEGEDRNVCGSAASAVEVTTDSQETCEAAYFNLATTAIHGVTVEGLEPGECEVTVDVLDSELAETVSVTVE